MQIAVACRTNLIAFFIALWFSQLMASPVAAQSRLLDREPFDQIILNQANGGNVLDVFPLTLSMRPLTVLPQEGRLPVRLLDRPDETFEVTWSHVAQVRVYEQILLDEARRLVSAREFDEAYDYFSRLLISYPSLPNLNESVNLFLRQNALQLHQSQQDERALSLLLTLAERNLADPGLPNAVEVVAGEIIESHLRDQDYTSARAVLNLWQTKFRNIATPAATAWQNRFEAAAERQLVDARRLADEKQFFAARQAAQRALAIWPTHQPAADFLARIQRESPSVVVGVLETAPRKPSHRIDDWATRRASRLTQRLLVEQIGFTSEGGEYASPWGQLLPDESGLSLKFKLARNEPARSAGGESLPADELARLFLSMADRQSARYDAQFADLLAGVAIVAGNTVELQWKRAHVRPESLLLVQPPSESAAQSSDPADALGTSFKIVDFNPDKVVYVSNMVAADRRANSSTEMQVQSVVEQSVADDHAVEALLAGDIDVLDRVPPWHLAQLRVANGIRLVPYRLPTVHVLIPNFDRPLAAKREFRRGLCYGIDRRWIVDRVLLGGASQAGFDVISGPFPAGASLSDPIRYAYNNQVTPRPFEPRLATILMTVAWAGLQKSSGASSEAALPELPQLVLAHPKDPIALVACQSIQTQLGRQGLTVVLRQFTAEELSAGPIDCDFRYAELAIWEPVTDARRIIGPGGLAGNAASPYIRATLRRLDEATNWKDVRATLSELHEIAHHDLPVIPLWQTVNYFAYRDTISGIGDSPLTLYQNASAWRITPRGAGRGTDR